MELVGNYWKLTESKWKLTEAPRNSATQIEIPSPPIPQFPSQRLSIPDPHHPHPLLTHSPTSSPDPVTDCHMSQHGCLRLSDYKHTGTGVQIRGPDSIRGPREEPLQISPHSLVSKKAYLQPWTNFVGNLWKLTTPARMSICICAHNHCINYQ